MQEKKINISFLVTAAFFTGLVSCGTSKLKKGEYLYTGAKVNIVNDTMKKKEKNALRDGIKDNLRPKPNTSLLGLRPRVWVYNITPEPKKDKGITHWLKNKIGEKPVLLGDVDRDFNAKIAQNYAENKGYFNTKATYDTLAKNKTAKVIYTVKPGVRYLINEVTYEKDSTKVNAEIQQTVSTSLLKKGDPFDLAVIKAERSRIDAHLKEKGFYYFHPDNLIVQADSTVTKEPKVDLNVKLKNDAPELSKKQFSIDKVVVFADYDLKSATDRNYIIPYGTDSVAAYNDMYIIDPDKKFKPQIFDRALYFKKGDIYNRSNHNLSLNRLISLGTFKFVKNQFVISDSIKNKFDAYYLLTPRQFQSLRVEATGKTNSANFVGSEVNLNWTHRNFFRGAEQLKASVFGAFDVQIGGPEEGKDNNNVYRFGGNVSLTIPRLVSPFNFKNSSGYVPKTFMGLGYEYQNRQALYSLHNFNGHFGYLWKEDAQREHELKLININVVVPQNVTEKYQAQIDDPDNLSRYIMKRVVEPQLIVGPTYSFTYTNTMLPKTNTFYYKGSVDLAGTLAGLISGANAKEGKEKKVFGVPFSQYAKTEQDLRFYHKLAEKSQIATRLIAGMAYPYGNSLYVPYSRQFYVGGSNSIRAFRARTLGPGSFDPRSAKNPFFYDQSGDIKLEFNAEYRANIYKFLNAAVFADAGNIWLVNEDPARPGGKFSKDWTKEIAVGAGVGLRLDFSILILRLDLAMPLRVPYLEQNQRWVLDKVNFGNAAWRKDNLILNIAIGYPF